MKRLAYILSLLTFVMLVGNVQVALAQVPARISYQGLLLDEGQTLSDGAYRVTFRLYADEETGPALWSETQTVSLQDGLLSTLLGAETALNLPFDRPYFLSVEVEGQPESERMALSAAPYALLARNVPDSTVVRSISGLRDQVELVAGPGIAIEQRHNRLIISAQQGLKGYGPDEAAGPMEPLAKKSPSPLTFEEDQKRLAEILSTLGPGGSNTGLDAAYDAGRVITLDDGQIVMQGTNTSDLGLLFRNSVGGSPAFRFQVDGVSTPQVWLLGLNPLTGTFLLSNGTAVTTPLRVLKSATNRLMALEGSAVKFRNAADEVKVTIDTNVSGDGRITTQELEITGGSDLSENFDISAGFGIAEPEPGMVVSIDPQRPGKLRVSGQPYDRMVAGVVSGAGGIETGLLMGQADSEADGAYPVALTGRVYVYVDAAYGSVSPGDLLTTSATPGHAMKVSDHGQAQGAIIGKAMTGLTEGRGLVLVLVSLQ